MLNLLASPALAATTAVNIEEVATAGNFFGYTCIGSLVSNLVAVAFIVSGIAFFGFLVLGGIQWLTSGGDKGKIEMAQRRISSALIGLTIVAASYAIFTLVLTFLGIDLSKLCTAEPVGP